jgi:hypothetical protein
MYRALIFEDDGKIRFLEKEALAACWRVHRRGESPACWGGLEPLRGAHPNKFGAPSPPNGVSSNLSDRLLDELDRTQPGWREKYIEHPLFGAILRQQKEQKKMGTCRIGFTDDRPFCEEHNCFADMFRGKVSVCPIGLYEERDSAIAERDSLAAQLAEAQERAQRERNESLLTCESLRENYESVLVDWKSMWVALDALTAKLAEEQEHAQVLESTLRKLLDDLAEARRSMGYWTDSYCNKAQAVLDTLAKGEETE